MDERFTKDGALRRALINSHRYGIPYYVRPTSDGKQYCVSDVEPPYYFAKTSRKLHDPEKWELRNMENWPVPAPPELPLVGERIN